MTDPVLHAYSVEPIDREALHQAVRDTLGKLVVIEDHWFEGGLKDLWRMSRQSSWRIIRHLVAPHPDSNPADSAAPSQGGRRSGPIVPRSRRRIGRRGKALRCWEIVATLEFGSLGTPSAFSVQSGRASRSVLLRG